MPGIAVSSRRLSRLSVCVRPIDDPVGYRNIQLVYRNSFPRRPLALGVAKLIVSKLPDGTEAEPDWKNVKPPGVA